VIAGTPAVAAPPVEQMVVFKSGRAVSARSSTRGLTVRVGRRRCAVGSATPLAALVRSKPGRIRLRDFGSCSRHARDAGGLYVAAIGREAERGRGGWVYKVGHKAATAGAADPSGPFGNGRLRRGRRVTWFYCLHAGDCQSTLELRVRAEAGAAMVSVRAYDDEGKGRRVQGATVSAGAVSATTGADGSARLALPPGRYRIHAEKPGLVRSFDEAAVVG
jgi:hypothetical protein